MEHTEFARIITAFEAVANDATAAAAEAHRIAAIAEGKRAALVEELTATKRELGLVKDRLANAGHVVAEKIASVSEHIHDAEQSRKQAFLDAARIARGVQL